MMPGALSPYIPVRILFLILLIESVFSLMRLRQRDLIFEQTALQVIFGSTPVVLVLQMRE